MVALRSQGNWRWEGPLGTPLVLVHWKRASSAVEAGTPYILFDFIFDAIEHQNLLKKNIEKQEK